MFIDFALFHCHVFFRSLYMFLWYLCGVFLVCFPANSFQVFFPGVFLRVLIYCLSWQVLQSLRFLLQHPKTQLGHARPAKMLGRDGFLVFASQP